MSLISRVKNILLSPNTEWQVIDTERATPWSLLFKYVIPLALISTVAGFIGYVLAGPGGDLLRTRLLRGMLLIALPDFLSSLMGYYISTYVVDLLAPNFGSPRNTGKSAQLVAYSYTAFWVAGIFSLLPFLFLCKLIGLYGIILFYFGIPILKRTPVDKRLLYMIVSAIVIIAVWAILSMLIGLLFLKLAGPGEPILP